MDIDTRIAGAARHLADAQASLVKADALLDPLIEGAIARGDPAEISALAERLPEGHYRNEMRRYQALVATAASKGVPTAIPSVAPVAAQTQASPETTLYATWFNLLVVPLNIAMAMTVGSPR